jgi:N-formylmaleamate deformylase
VRVVSPRALRRCYRAVVSTHASPGWFPSRSHRPLLAGMRPAALQAGFVDLNGTRLAWTRSGRGAGSAPSVLLAHGLTDSAACWDRVAAVLAPSYDVVRYDARGHGASDRAPAYSVELNTADLIGLVRELGLDRPVLIGHSMGGVHAALAAAELDVRALVLEDPHWPETPEDGSKDIGASRRSVVEAAALPLGRRWARGRGEHPTWADVDLDAWVRAQDRVDPDVVGWFSSWPVTNRWREHVAKLDCPGLLVTGSRSPTVTPSAAAQARNRWAQLQTVQINDAGHNVRRDQFDPYWRAVRTFLNTLT